MKHNSRLRFVIVCLAMALFRMTAFGQGTEFTYQGLLDEQGAPANGVYDFQFAVYDADEPGGTVIGGSITVPSTSVNNGAFTAILDFGAVFDGSDRWLEIAVQPSGGGGYTVLTPRQAILPVPYALFASTAASGGGTSSGDVWSLNGGNAYYTSGKVGIGTSAPAHRLSLANGPGWTANGWKGSLDLDNASAIGWQPDAAGNSFGIGQTGGGLYLFHTTNGPATTGAPANYDIEISDYGSVNILNSLSIGGGLSLTGEFFIDGDVFPNLDGEQTLGGGFGGAWYSVLAYHYNSPSDQRLKKAITPLQYGTRELMLLRPVTYQWKSRADTRVQLGLVAQDVQSIIPEVVYGDLDAGDTLQISYVELVPLLIKAFQEQQSAAGNTAADLAAVKAENAALKIRISELDGRLKAIEQNLAAMSRADEAPR